MKDSMINVQYKFSSEIGPNRIIWPLKQSIVSFGAKGKATGAGDKMKTRKTWGGQENLYLLNICWLIFRTSFTFWFILDSTLDLLLCLWDMLVCHVFVVLGLWLLQHELLTEPLLAQIQRRKKYWVKWVKFQVSLVTVGVCFTEH